MTDARFGALRRSHLGVRRGMQRGQGIALPTRRLGALLRRGEFERLGLLGLLTQFQQALQSEREHQRRTTANSIASAIFANAAYVSP